MKNKEIEELINDIKKHDYKVINKEDYILLLSYIEQLENNRDKAIEFIENHFLYHYGSDKAPTVFEDNYIQKIVDILKGDSE